MKLHPIRKVNDYYGYQIIDLGRTQDLKRGYVKIWRLADMVVVDRALTVKAARKRIRSMFF